MNTGSDSDFLPLPLGEGRGEGCRPRALSMYLKNVSSGLYLHQRLLRSMPSSQLQTSSITSASSNSNLKGIEMTKKFSALRAGMSQVARQRSDANVIVMLAEMPLNELRQARSLSQKLLADVLHVQQSSIAKIEKRTDMYLSTLRSHIEAMAGELSVIARFTDGVVKINNFSELNAV